MCVDRYERGLYYSRCGASRVGLGAHQSKSWALSLEILALLPLLIEVKHGRLVWTFRRMVYYLLAVSAG